MHSTVACTMAATEFFPLSCFLMRDLLYRVFYKMYSSARRDNFVNARFVLASHWPIWGATALARLARAQLIGVDGVEPQ